MSEQHYPHLLSEGRIGTLTLRNRIIVTAMGVSLSEDDGSVGERLMAFHEEQAAGGAGLIVMGVTGVAWPEASVTIGQTAISDDKFISGLTQLTQRVHAKGGKIAAQLHHGGLVAGYAFNRWGHPLLAPGIPPAATGGFIDYFLPDELTSLDGAGAAEIKVMDQADIDRAVGQYAAAARRAVAAGFDGLEIHGGHGYLLSSFISPYTNQRTDGYGGSLEARMRLPIEVVTAIRNEIGHDFPVWFKLDSREIGKQGITIEDAKVSAQMLEAAGVDAITVTSYHQTDIGKLHSESNIPHVNNWNLPATAEIRAAVNIPVIGSGRIELSDADTAIAKGDTDFVAMGRKLLADPHLPRKITTGAPEDVRPCVYCYTCVSAIYMGDPVRCAVNSELANEYERQPASAPSGQKVAVIGGGPGGMETARRLALAGADVTLFEQSDRLGGTLRFASIAYEPNERLLNWLTREVKQAGIAIRLSTTATPELLHAEGFSNLVVATGAKRAMPPIPGGDQDHVLSGDDLRNLILGGSSEALKSKTSLFTRAAAKIGAVTGASANPDIIRKATHAWMPLGKSIAIIGGELVGLELAEFLRERGREVHVIEESPRFGRGLPLVRRMRLIAELEEHGVHFHANASGIAIAAQTVRFTDASGQQQEIPAASVIVAKGAQGDLALADTLRSAGFNVEVVGDANGVGYIEGAMHSARKAVRTLLTETV